MGGDTKSDMASASSAHYPQLAAKPVGKQISSIYKARLGQFTDNGQYSAQSLNAQMYEDRLSGSPHIKLHVWSAPDLTRPTFEEATCKENKYRKTSKGESFGPAWSTHWFKVQFKLPESWITRPQLELHWNSSGEAMVWTEDGKPLQALSAQARARFDLEACHPHNRVRGARATHAPVRPLFWGCCGSRASTRNDPAGYDTP